MVCLVRLTNYYELKKFFGYGTQADRFLLTKARDDLKIKSMRLKIIVII